MTHRDPLDPNTVERLLAGRVKPDDAPSGFGQVSRLLNAAASPAKGSAVAESAIVASMATAISALPQHTPIVPRRKKMLTKLLSAKAAVAALAAVGLSATGAAAATGSLPTAAQDGVSKALSHAGVHVPKGKSADHKPNAHANFGLCQAAAAHTANGATPSSPNFTGLDCTNVTHPGNKPDHAGTSKKPDDPGSQGNKPADSGNKGKTHKPADAGTEGTSTKPADAGTEGTSTKPADAGSQGAGHRP